MKKMAVEKFKAPVAKVVPVAAEERIVWVYGRRVQN